MSHVQMSFYFRTRIHSHATNNSLSSFLNPLCSQTRSKLSQTLNPALVMATESSSKRPTCPSCSKPSRLCLCIRIKTPSLNNSVGVTIFQHSLERNHPLNSTRIATLGLKNLNVTSVSDVNFEARFVIRSLELDSEMGSKSSYFDNVSDFELTQNGVFDKIDGSTSKRGSVDSEEGNSKPVEPDLSSEFDSVHKNKRIRLGIHHIGEVPRGVEGPLITFTIGKYGVISSFVHNLMPQTQSQNLNFDLLLASPAVLDALSKGFVVKKWQSKQLNGSIKIEEFEEFEIAVPPGSVLLFPSEKSVGIEAIDFKVRNLIVLDGTWSKAKRMYKENPWLKLLPLLKLDLDKMSLYSDVRRQPRVGCLSTIESIVYTLKAVGDESDGLDNLLDVFESMIGDQRRCKDERLSKTSLG
ncbi:uncharacterized protein LOC114292930 [Camellia sinensis]|nr:uncharacterized protein LOC114292930 [Camellia sinensis]